MEIDQCIWGVNFVSIQNVANIAVAQLWLIGNLPVHCIPNPHHRQNIKKIKEEGKIQVK